MARTPCAKLALHNLCHAADRLRESGSRLHIPAAARVPATLTSLQGHFLALKYSADLYTSGEEQASMVDIFLFIFQGRRSRKEGNMKLRPCE